MWNPEPSRPRRPWWSHVIATLVVVVLGLLFVPAEALCEPGDWPRFRGPSLDGKSTETGIVDAWGPDGPREMWRIPGGQGYSGLSVADGRVYTLVGRGGDELAVAHDAKTGRELWRHRLDGNYQDGMGSGPRSTPAVDGDVVYVLGAQGVLAALDAKTGEPRWTQDLKKSFGARAPQWGISTSPLVLGDVLLVDVGGRDGASVVALNKRDGIVRWSAGSDKAGYSMPLPVEVGGVRQVVFFTGTRVQGVDPADGDVFWSKPWKTSYDVNAAAPVLVPPDKLFISSGYDTGAALFRLTAADGEARAEEVWSSRRMKNQFSSSIYLDGHIYGFDNSILKCLDAATGQEGWLARGFGHGSMTYADGKLIVLGERGKLALVDASCGEAPRELASHQVFNGKTWTVPTLANGILYLRDENEIVALDLKQRQAPGRSGAD